VEERVEVIFARLPKDFANPSRITLKIAAYFL
jgi:hypothetical protein